ncbi:hypothetical protein pipiens_008934 [Culex pipiens pipiens]|uniref:Odorant receptor n=1 Tax=Culex pipiens pipiens TaxID=38569 RepID=A0ABD1DGC4_CULPP
MDRFRKALSQCRHLKTSFFLILAGFHFTPQNRWQSVVWTLYRCLPYSYLYIALISLFSALIFRENSITIIRTTVIVVMMADCFVKHRLLLRYGDEIRKLRNYLESPTFGSGETTFDESVRKRFRRSARVLIIGISSIITVQQILAWVPNEQLSEAFYIHPWVGSIWGENVALAIRIWYISIFSAVWLFKLYGCTVTSIVLMMGLEAEQKVLAHNFKRIQDCLEDLRQSYWDSELARKQYWDRVRDVASGVGEPTTAAYEVIVLAYGKEVYSMCFMVDSMKNAFDSIAGPMLYWCVRFPYSEDHHGTYVEMRTTLQIIAACSRNIVSFGCAGISDISVAVFADMLNICYSVFTFLRDTT